MLFSLALPRQIRGRGAEQGELAKPQIRLTVSGNRLTLARSYFTGTAKQKNNSKTRLSRKPARKFNKWLLLSQCSHNWWPEMGMDVRQRFWFHWINCYQMLAGRWCHCRVVRPSALKQPGPFSQTQALASEPDCLLCVLTNWWNTCELNVCMLNTLERRKKGPFSVFLHSVGATRLSLQLLFSPRLEQTNKKTKCPLSSLPGSCVAASVRSFPCH